MSEARRTPYKIMRTCVLEVCARGVLGSSFFFIRVSLFSLSSDCYGGESPTAAALWAPHSPQEHSSGHLSCPSRAALWGRPGLGKSPPLLRASVGFQWPLLRMPPRQLTAHCHLFLLFLNLFFKFNLSTNTITPTGHHVTCPP